MIAIDTETTGLDIYHGARPFLVSICTEDYENIYWEWPVDPWTREVQVDYQDMLEIENWIHHADRLVLQNASFDVAMLLQFLPDRFSWPWEKTHDTLVSAHLLASDKPRDLTSLALRYLDVDVRKYDEECKRVVTACRNYIDNNETEIGEWRIARKGMKEMPSTKEKAWKCDLWLPRAFGTYFESRGEALPIDHISDEDLYDRVAEYANNDTATTLAVYQVHQEMIEERNLTAIYETRRRVEPVVHEMQAGGVHVNGVRLRDMIKEYSKEADEAGNTCCEIAATYTDQEGRPFDLVLPKSGVNNSIRKLVFHRMKMPVVKTSKKTGQPSMDKEVLESYILTLDPEDYRSVFFRALSDKRKRDTALSYMESYKKFWLPTDWEGWYVLHPSLNSTGSFTLRFSSSNPNEQNISKKEGFNLRYNFGPPPGFEWWSMDAKNIELRLPAYESGEQELIDLFENPDEPPYYGSTHLLNFHTVYPQVWKEALDKVGIEKVGPYCKKAYASTWYQRCKNGGFAVQYGAVLKAGGGGTADKAFGVKGAHAKLKERFDRLEALNQKYIDQANETGYVETIPDRSVDPNQGYPLFCERTELGDVKPTTPLNYHTQGSAMWWMIKAMIRCQEQITRWQQQGIHCRIVMQIHDELVFEFKRGSNLPKVRKLAKLMEQGGEDYGIPTPVGAELHRDNWSEGKTLLG